MVFRNLGKLFTILVEITQFFAHLDGSLLSLLWPYCSSRLSNSVTRLDDLVDFGRVLKAFSNN